MIQTIERASPESGTPEAGGVPSEHPAIAAGAVILVNLIGDQQPTDLPQWRGVIDELDFIIMATAAARALATGKVSGLKVDQGLPGIDLRRENEITGEAVQAGNAIGMEPRAVQGFFLALIDVAHQQHKLARQTKPEDRL